MKDVNRRLTTEGGVEKVTSGGVEKVTEEEEIFSRLETQYHLSLRPS